METLRAARVRLAGPSPASTPVLSVRFVESVLRMRERLSPATRRTMLGVNARETTISTRIHGRVSPAISARTATVRRARAALARTRFA